MGNTEIVLNSTHPKFPNIVYWEEMFLDAKEDNRVWFRAYCQEAFDKLETDASHLDVPAEASRLNGAKW